MHLTKPLAFVWRGAALLFSVMMSSGCTVYALIGHEHPLVLRVVDRENRPVPDAQIQLTAFRLTTWDEWQDLNTWSQRNEAVKTDNDGHASMVFKFQRCDEYLRVFPLGLISVSKPRLAGLKIEVSDAKHRSQRYAFEQSFSATLPTDLGRVTFHPTGS